MNTNDLTERIGRILNDEGWTFEGVHEPGEYDECEDCRRVVDPVAARIAEEVAAHDARVRRDAAREALDGLAADALRTASNEDVQRDDTWADDARLVARSATEYRDTHYPEETP